MTTGLELNRNVRPVNRWKAAFPSLQAEDGKALHYLDNAATTQKPGAVIEAIKHCYTQGEGPIHRGLYPLAETASLAYEQARRQVARFIGATKAQQLVFTRSATESINMVPLGWLRPRLHPGDRVWVTRMEHHANFLPWQRVCRETGAELKIIELNEDGTLNLDDAAGLFDKRTRLIALCQVSNVLGIENPVQTICRLAAVARIPVLVDAAQSVAHLPVDVSTLGCDFLAFSAHKTYGPGGMGALYGRTERLEEMEPLLVGGGMVDIVEDNRASWAELPGRLEAGSPNLAGAVGFGAALEWLDGLGMDQVRTHEADLARQARAALASLPGVRLLPEELTDSTIVSFVIEDIHPHDVSQVAGSRGVALRAGHHCCQPLMRHLGLSATVRASFAVYNDLDDITALCDAIEETLTLFR